MTRHLPIIACLMTALSCSATTYTAATAAFSDVSAAYHATHDGDTLNIPAGTATWSSELYVTNSINIIGAGTNLTFITNNNGILIEWVPINNKALRLSGLSFISQDSHVGVVLIYGPDYAVRVDHCLFNKGDRPLVFNQAYIGNYTATGPVYGVVDHCTFINCSRPMFVCDHENTDGNYPYMVSPGNVYGATEWSRTILPGTTNMVVYEDNYLEDNASFSSGVSDTTAIYGTGGGKRCFRHNTFKGAEEYIDMHGDNPDYSVQYYEVYSNLFIYGTYGTLDQIGNQRGGTTIYYGNILSNYSGNSNLELTRYWVTDIHTVTNSYFWNNSGMVPEINDVPTCSGCSSATILLGQQYFTNAPQSGQTFYPYTALVYPHPMIGGLPPPPPNSISIDCPIFTTGKMP